MLEQLITKNRSYRRFYQEVSISAEMVKSWINLARLSASARNAQSLKYVISTDIELNNSIFSTLTWAGYLTQWPGPEEGERPSAYIVMLNDTNITENYYCDDGIAAQSILLGAVEKGFGGCILSSVNKKQLKEILHLDDNIKIIQVIALGKPKEEVIIEEMKNNDIKYWRDDKQVHHVPKRNLDEIIIKINPQ